MIDIFQTIARLAESTAESWQEAEAAKAKRNKLLSYWTELSNDFQYSPRQFYALVLRNLDHRQIPGLEIEPANLRAGGVFSERRLYLRLRRERLVFEVCAAPFGTAFFVSCRLFDRRRDAGWIHYLMMIALLAGIGYVLWTTLGWVWAAIVLSGLATFVWSFMRLSLQQEMVALQDALPEIPLIGPLYESWFRPETYYRQDLNECYRTAVEKTVKQTLGEVLSQSGLKALAPAEAAPAIAALHQK